MHEQKDLKDNARAFVTRALTKAEGKRPTGKAVSEAVEKIVENFAPICLASHREEASSQKRGP